MRIRKFCHAGGARSEERYEEAKAPRCSQSGSRLEFKLEGTKSNRDGIGARIKLVAGGMTQYNQVSFAAGYASSSAGPIHFGVGANKSADLVEIRWPSGIVQDIGNVPADRVVRVKEPAK